MIDCPYEEEECYEDDLATLCDGCREDRAWDRAQLRNDTFD